MQIGKILDAGRAGVIDQGVWRDLAPGVRALSGGTLLRLREAAETGEILTIVYRRGSQPGTKRDIAVRSADRTDVRAQCLATGEFRTFKVEHLEIVDPDAPFPAYGSARQPDTAKRDDVEAIVAAHYDELTSLGWAVVGSPEGISLFRCDDFGNPNPEIAVALVRDVSKSGKPTWAVHARGGKVRTRKLLGSAAVLFLDTARKRAGRVNAKIGRATVARERHFLRGLGWAAAAFVLGLARGLFIDARAASASEWHYMPPKPGEDGPHAVITRLVDNGVAGFSCTGPKDIRISYHATEFSAPKGEKYGTLVAPPNLQITIDRAPAVRLHAAYSVEPHRGERRTYAAISQETLDVATMKAAAASTYRIVFLLELGGAIASKSVTAPGDGAEAFQNFAAACKLW